MTATRGTTLAKLLQIVFLGKDYIYILIVIILSFLIGAVMMVFSGANPLIAYSALLQSAFGSVHSLSETMAKTCPLLLAGLGTVVAYRCKFWNIGSEGQIYIGGIVAALIGTLPLYVPSVIHILFIFLASFLGGGLYALIPGFLKAKFRINEVIVTMMLNYISIHLVSFLLHGPMRDPQSYLPISKRLQETATLPILIPTTRFHLGIVVALALAILVHLLIWKSILGFRIRAVGENERAARVGGINPMTVLLWAALISGGLSGFAGSLEIIGIQRRLIEGFSPGYGYLAIAVALIGNLKPMGVVFSSVLFGALLSGANAMQSIANVPASIIYVIEGLIIMAISARLFARWRLV